MIYRLVDFALVFLKLLMFKVGEIIGILKIEFFNFTNTERVNWKDVIDWTVDSLSDSFLTWRWN